MFPGVEQHGAEYEALGFEVRWQAVVCGIWRRDWFFATLHM
jgi:hypothetical protein